jgi:phosphopantetheinyl transferase
MFVRSSRQSGDGDGSAQPLFERERITLSNVQIDSWLTVLDSPASEQAELVINALRSVLARYVWRRPEALEFFEGPLGRMYLRDDVMGRPLYFASATAGKVLVVLVSREPRMGLELASPSEADALIPRVETEICAQERDVIAGLSPPARRRALLSLWTRKRALQRANAVNGIVSMKSIAVGLGELALELPPTFGWLHQWRLHGFSLRSGELGSIAVYRHDQLLIVGAGDRRTSSRRGSPVAERRRDLAI